MENASKALLIAGAVLIAILLISVGIRIINSTSGMTEHVDTTSQSVAAATFNSQFLSYLSNSTSGTKAKALVSKIIAHNATVSSASTFSLNSHQIYVNLKDKNDKHITTSKSGHNWTSSELQDVYSKISDTSRYEIFVTTGCTMSGTNGGYYKGYVMCITIKEK